jgi:hypothetical protein
MTDLLEHTLQDTFSRQAEQLAPDSVQRVLTSDYRRRARARRTITAIAAVASAAAVSAALLLTSNPAPAFAGWSPTPQTASHETAAGQCLGGTPVLTDARGPYTAVVYSLPDGVGTCLQKDGSVLFSGTATGPGEKTVSPHAIGTFIATSTDAHGNKFTILYGPAGASVTAVRVEREHGAPVDATVSDGWYLAWWPDSSPVTATQVTTAEGTHNTAFPSAAAQQAASCSDMGPCSATGYAPGSGS